MYVNASHGKSVIAFLGYVDIVTLEIAFLGDLIDLTCFVNFDRGSQIWLLRQTT